MGSLGSKTALITAPAGARARATPRHQGAAAGATGFNAEHGWESPNGPLTCQENASPLCSAAGDHEKQQPWNRPPHTPVPQVPLMQLLGLFEGLVCSQIGRTQGAGRAANADRKVAKIVR